MSSGHGDTPPCSTGALKTWARPLFSFDRDATIDARLKPSSPSALSPAPGIFVFPLLTESFCRRIVWLHDLIDSFVPDPDDPYPGREFRADQVKPFEAVIKEVFTRGVAPALDALYGFSVTDIVDCFVLRYSPDTQAGMAEHFDHASDLSLVVPLNAGFDGGGLVFPRQGWITTNVPIGHAVSFPGRVTHPHYAADVTGGVRFSQTWWLAGAG